MYRTCMNSVDVFRVERVRNRMVNFRKTREEREKERAARPSRQTRMEDFFRITRKRGQVNKMQPSPKNIFLIWLFLLFIFSFLFFVHGEKHHNTHFQCLCIWCVYLSKQLSLSVSPPLACGSCWLFKHQYKKTKVKIRPLVVVNTDKERTCAVAALHKG